MVTIYMIKESAALRIQGTRANAYREMYSLSDLGWKPVNKTKYEGKKKEILTANTGPLASPQGRGCGASAGTGSASGTGQLAVAS